MFVLRLKLILFAAPIVLLALAACGGVDQQAAPEEPAETVITEPSPAEPEPTTPVSSPDAAPSEGSTIAGCPLFPADNYWNTPIDSLPTHPNSDAYIAAIGKKTTLHPDFGSGTWEGETIGIPYDVISGDQARVPVAFDYADESDPGPYPIPADATIEGGPDVDGDRHILLVDQDDCMLYEIYYAWPEDDESWWAGSGAVFDLDSNALRPDSWTSADAAGLPILAGLVRYDEVASGEIRHAIRFTALAIREEHTWPARHHATCSKGSRREKLPPFGQRFRLKASFDISPYPEDIQVILTAFKTYGLVLADCGSDWFINGVPDERWDNDQLVEMFSTLSGSDFEAVDVSSLMVDPDSAQAR